MDFRWTVFVENLHEYSLLETAKGSVTGVTEVIQRGCDQETTWDQLQIAVYNTLTLIL